MSRNPKEEQREYSRRYRSEHPEKSREHTRQGKQKLVANRRSRGLCIECGNPVEKSRLRCSQCLERRRSRIAQRKREGKCIVCPNIAIIGCRYCQKCYLKDTSQRHLETRARWHELLELFNKQNGICALSGQPLTLGVNADIDHIIPRSRGGGNDLNNLQWVLASVNTMKDNLLEDEFFTLIKTVYLYMQKKCQDAP